MIEKAKSGTLHDRRQVLGWVYEESVVTALFEGVKERYMDRQGGYCRVLKTISRRGDNAKMAVIELV
jgi:large subunit ribosomal protein L17